MTPLAANYEASKQEQQQEMGPRYHQTVKIDKDVPMQRKKQLQTSRKTEMHVGG